MSNYNTGSPQTWASDGGPGSNLHQKEKCSWIAVEAAADPTLLEILRPNQSGSLGLGRIVPSAKQNCPALVMRKWKPKIE